ncbi:MAG: aminoacyl-tRNA hydrolase [Chlamydiia bacterium]|nr:aminoacyl-tRNA hydrolase [Chlamydiia bacterium]
MFANPFLIAGLGNPGKEYEKTRHNIGFRALDVIAEKYRLSFGRHAKWQGRVAQGQIGSAEVVLLMPRTFMNQSGVSVAAAMGDLRIELSRLLLVVDDIALPVGQIRMRINSGSGGHNGLKSVEEHLQTNRFARLRIGIGDREEGDLTDHVLGKFSLEEERLIPEILERALQAMELWFEKGLTSAMDFANRKHPSNPSNGVV